MLKDKEFQKIKYPIIEDSCACKVSLDYLGDKWILLIIRDLFRYRYTFSDFLHKNTEERIATNVLSDRLKKLLDLKIINYRLNENNKKIKEYYLTNRGIELYDIIFQLQYWTLSNVDFNHSENTKNWKTSLASKSRETIIKEKKDNYKKFRKKIFNF